MCRSGLLSAGVLLSALSGPVSGWEFEVPEGYAEQVLAPTGGRIARPEGWHYVERHGATTYRWIIALENPDEQPYETGVSIQMLPGVTEPTGLAPQVFAESFIANKKQTAEHLGDCAAESGDLLSSLCIEVLEQVEQPDGSEHAYRIRYALYWGNYNLDMVVVMVAGTTPEKWEDMAGIFQTMAHFQVLDLNAPPESAAD